MTQLLTPEQIAVKLGEPWAEYPPEKQRKYVMREVRKNGIPFIRVGRARKLTHEAFEMLKEAMTVWPSDLPELKAQKTGTSVARSAARRSLKALDYVTKNSQRRTE